MLLKADGKGPTLCISRGRVRAHIYTRTASTFFPETPGIFYVFLSGNVGFRLGKRTFLGRETYVSHAGNIENIEATENYLTGISSIRNIWMEKTESLKNKRDAYKKEQAAAYKEKQKEQLEGKLTEKRTNKRTAQQTEKKRKPHLRT